MRAVAIALDGVLRKPLDVEAQDFGASLLFASLVDHFRVIILGTGDEARDEHFLAVNGMRKYVKIEGVHAGDGESTQERQRAQVTRLRAEGNTFEFVVIPDPGLAAQLYADGVPVLLYVHPQFSGKVVRPDHVMGIRPWSELAAEVEFQRTEKAKSMEQGIV